MPTIEVTTHIAAPVERCFDLSRSIDLHQDSQSASDERAVYGVTSGLIDLGQSVTWEARHLGVRQRLTSRITAFDRPRHFRDSMVAGAFAQLDHDHWFESDGATGTVMRDVFYFEAPLGILGRIAELLVLTPYMRRLLIARNAVVKRVAESEKWRRYLPPPGPPSR
ncbi:MAG: SRPBCC family protein [Deltaproteobacteria bacterium]|nr:SRPBCC family protein [Deltaproteobacteria bacterium]